MQIIGNNLRAIFFNFKKFRRFGRGGVMVPISALFLLGASGDRCIEQRQLEAKEYIDLINRGQQAYYVEEGSFTNRIDELGLHIVLGFDMPTETEDYSYRIKTLEEERVVIIAIPKNRDLKSYTGAAFLINDGYLREIQAIICESDRPSQVPPVIAPTEDGFICGLNSSPPVANLSIEERQLEAKQYIASINKGQQAYYVKRGNFTDKIEKLGLGIRTETESYRYQVKTFDDKWVVTTATPKINGLKSYTGVVFLVSSQEYFITKSIVCESDRPSSLPPFTAWVGDEVKCVFGSSEL